MVQWLGSLAALTEDLGLVSTLWLTTIPNSSSRGSDALFGLQRHYACA